MSRTPHMRPCVTRRAAPALLASLTALGLVAMPASAQQDYTKYFTDTSTSVITQFPGTVTSSDSQGGGNPSLWYQSLVSIDSGVQVGYAYATPGVSGVFVHGQTAPYSIFDTTAASLFSETAINADSRVNDVFTVPKDAPAVVSIRFNLVPSGSFFSSFDPRTAALGWRGSYNFSSRAAASLTVKDLTTGTASVTNFYEQLADDGSPEFGSIPQAFTFTASPGDTISVYTDSSAVADAFIVGDYFEIDFSHTFHTYADVLTPGVTLTSLSGHDYSTPAPEPSAFAGLALGALGLGGLALRARRRFAQD